jgi:hypothetical protein
MEPSASAHARAQRRGRVLNFEWPFASEREPLLMRWLHIMAGTQKETPPFPPRESTERAGPEEAVSSEKLRTRFLNGLVRLFYPLLSFGLGIRVWIQCLDGLA